MLLIPEIFEGRFSNFFVGKIFRGNFRILQDFFLKQIEEYFTEGLLLNSPLAKVKLFCHTIFFLSTTLFGIQQKRSKGW